MNYLKRLDVFDRTIVAIIGVTMVLLLFYGGISSLYTQYLKTHLVTFSDEHVDKRVNDWNQYASNGDVMHIVLYGDNPSTKQHEKQVAKYMMKRFNKDNNYEPVAVDTTNKESVASLKASKAIENKQLPDNLTIYTFSKEDNEVDENKLYLPKNQSKDMVKIALDRLK